MNEQWYLNPFEIKKIPLFNQIQSYIDKKFKSNISAVASIEISLNKVVDKEQDSDNDSVDENNIIKKIRPDHL